MPTHPNGPDCPSGALAFSWPREATLAGIAGFGPFLDAAAWLLHAR